MRKILFLYLFSILFFSACAEYSIVLSVKRDARIKLGSYKQIAIGKINNPSNSNTAFGTSAGNDLSAMIEKLILDGKYFELIDRTNIDKVLREHKLQSAGLTEDSTNIELGNIVGAATMIFGSVNNCSFTSNVSKNNLAIANTQFGVYKRETQFIFTASLKIVDVATSKILFIKEYDASKQKTETTALVSPNEEDMATLYRSVLEKVAKQFVEEFQSHKIYFNIDFENDRNFNELPKIITLLKIDETENALYLLKTISQKEYKDPITKAKSLYNYGTVLMLKGQPTEALNILKIALQLGDKNRQDKYANAILYCKKEIELLNKQNEKPF